MAIGGPLKGNSSSNRGRPYGMMLLLAFGAAIFGVMVLHKLRERRVFNLLLTEKDRELISLQLFLQKERDSSKELKRKSEGMKTKIYSLRTQKMELDSRLLEMQSTIASLKDEQRTMESALEEKQNEVKMMLEKEIDSDKEITSSQVKALTEMLKQKEAEVEDLKRRVELQATVWSVSTDHASNPLVNLTARGSMAQNDGTEGIASIEDGGQLHGSTEYKYGDNSTRGEGRSQNESSNHKESESSSRAKDGNENGQSVTERREMTGEERLQKPDGGAAAENSIDEVQGKKNENSQNGGSFGVGEEKKNATADAATGDGKVWKGRDEVTNIKATMDDKEHGNTRDGQPKKLKISVDGGGGREFGTVSKGGMKLEMSDGSQNGAGSRVRGKHGNASKTRGKRWRMIAKNRGLEQNGDSENMGAESMRNRRFFKAQLESERLKAPSEKKEKSDGRTERKGGENGEDNHRQVRKAVISSEAKLTNPKSPEEINNLRTEVENTDTNHQIEKYGSLGKPHYSLNGEVSTNRSINSDVGKQKLAEEAGGIQQNIDSRDVNRVENSAEQVKVADEDEELEDLETDEANNGDAFRESNSNMEEEYMEETDEPEF